MLKQQYDRLLSEFTNLENDLRKETERNIRLRKELEELQSKKSKEQQRVAAVVEDPFNSPLSTENNEEFEDVFSDEYEVDESWLSQHLDPFNSVVYQSAVLNPALAIFDSANDDEPHVSLEGLKKTWSLSVDPELVKNISNEERKRQEAIFELISTERSYVQALQTILDVFYMPLRTQKLMTTADLAAIFINVDSLLVCHVKILSDLEQVQRRDKLMVKTIGSCMLKHAEIVRLDANECVDAEDRVTSLLGYLEYCSNQMAACKLLQTRRSSDPKLAQFLKSAQMSERGKNLDLSSYLLEPMQRITRYPLLLKQILHYTPKDHPDQPNMLECLKLTEHLLSMVNLAAKEAESRSQLVELNKVIQWESRAKDGTLQDFKLDLTSSTRMLGPRILMHDGILFKAKSGKKLHVFLFNDMILFTQPIKEGSMKYRIYRQPLPLSEIMLRQKSSSAKQSSAANDKDLGIELGHGTEILALRAADSKAKKTWLQKLQDASNFVYNAQKSFSSVNKKEKLVDKSNCIGTVNVLILECQNLDIPQLGDHVNVETAVYCRASIAGQQGLTPQKPIFSRQSLKFNTPMLFSIESIDENLSFKVYASDKYSRDEVVGEASIHLDFLEYYGNKDTEIITLNLKRSEANAGKLQIRLNYRAHV